MAAGSGSWALIDGQHDVPVAVVGSGGFGTCLAYLLARNGLEVRLWCRQPDYAQTLQNTRENAKYLPGVKLPLNVWITSSLQDAVQDAEVVVAAVPSQAMRQTATDFKPHLAKGAKVLNVAKGIEHGSYKRMSEVLGEVLGAATPIATLSGPNHAEEIARGMPTATVIASKNQNALNLLCDVLTTDWFKAYPRRDLVGVELGGVLKNITALAAGVTKGIGFGDNSTSAVITLGLDEMVRFGVAHGARKETFTGLSGLGDLIATATSPHSRNRRVGELLGRGLTMQEALATMGGQVAEGVHAARFVHEQAEKEKIPLPLTTEIYRILYERKDVRLAVKDLLALL
jgi:glycerol-3-phosphate dehydrogenase (NAD(P)+)